MGANRQAPNTKVAALAMCHSCVSNYSLNKLYHSYTNNTLIIE